MVIREQIIVRGLDPDEKLTKNFALWEVFHSKTAAANGIVNLPSPELVFPVIENARLLAINVLQPIRDKYGIIKITSWYRCSALNSLRRGESKSQHLIAQAADFIIPSRMVDFDRVYTEIGEMGLPFDQLIYESKRSGEWIHISYNESFNRKQEFEIVT